MQDDRPLPRMTLDEPGRRGVLDRIALAVATVPEVRIAFAFGSFARGEPFRDIDVGVVLAEPFAWWLPGRVGDDVRDAVGPTPRPLDVVPLNDAPPRFRDEASSGVLLYEHEPGAGIDFWVIARSERIDLETWRRIHGQVPAP